MSRTTRRRPYGYNPGEFRHERAKTEDNYKAFDRDDIYHNRDWKPLTEVHDGCSKSPKGWNDRTSVGTNRRRAAKRHGAHVNRQRGKEAIRRDLSVD